MYLSLYETYIVLHSDDNMIRSELCLTEQSRRRFEMDRSMSDSRYEGIWSTSLAV